MKVDVADLVVHLNRRWATVALANLVRNAHRHGCEHVVVTAAWSPTDRLLRIRMSDDGPGFDEDFRPAAFERFRRAESSRTPALASAWRWSAHRAGARRQRPHPADRAGSGRTSGTPPPRVNASN